MTDDDLKTSLFDVPAPVEAPEEDPARELYDELTPRLDAEKAKAISQDVYLEIKQALQDRTEWEARLKEWDDLYYGRVMDKDFPWPGASNFHVPITMLGVETYKPRLVEAILGQNPPLIVVPTTAGGEERKLKVETVLNWQIQSQLKLESTVAEAAHLFLNPGIVIAKVYWFVDRSWKKFVREFDVQTPLPAVFEAIFGSEKPRRLKQTGPTSWTGEIQASPAGGANLECKIKVSVLEDAIQVLVEREEVLERPRVDLIEPIDIIAPVKGGTSPNDLPFFTHRLWMSEDDLRRKVQLNRFYPDVVQKVLDSATPKGDQPTGDSMGYRKSQDQAEGIEGFGPSNVRSEQYEVFETYRRLDIDNDGFEEEVILWTCPHAPDDLLGWDYRDNVYGHGRRPFRVGRFFPVPFRFYGLSFPEVVSHIQDEINAIHNQKNDYATLQNLPFGFKRASATLPPIQQKIRPGEFIDVDNPQQDILIPKFQGTPAWGAQEEATLMQYFERLSGLNDLTLGRQPNRVGATRTAKGTQALLSEAGLRFKTSMQAFQRFWVGIFEDILALDQEYLPPAQEFRVTGRRPTVLKIKDRTELRGNYDIRLTTTTESFNREQMREDATIVMQALLNPGAIQTGIVGRKGVKRSYEDLLKAYGKDPDFYLEPDAPVLSPREELMMFVAGTYVSPVMGEDVQTHLQEHQMALIDPLTPPEVRGLIKKHIGETIQLAQTQMMVQSLQSRGARPPVGPQAENAARGAMPQGPGQPTNGQPPQVSTPGMGVNG